MAVATAKTTKKTQIQEESIESKPQTMANASIVGNMSDISNDVLSDLWNNLVGGTVKTMSEQILGASPASRAAELYPGKIIDLQQKRQERAASVPRSEGHMEYFRSIQSADVLPKRQEDASIDRRVEEFRIEIKQLMKTSKQLETTFKSVQVEQRIVKAGRYHENLFDFIKALLRSARIRMEEGLSWSSMTKSKKQQKQYWSMFKKHGTTFGLSNERTVATQTG